MTKKSTNNRRNVGADACTTAQEHATAAIARDPGSCITEFEGSARPRAAGGMRERCTRPIIASSGLVAVAKIALELSHEGPRG